MWYEVVIYSCRETLRHPSQDALLLTIFARLTCRFDVFHSSVPSEFNTRCKMGQSWELRRPWSCFHARARRCFVPRNVACHIHDEGLPLAPSKHFCSPHLWNAMPLRGTWSMQTFLILVCDQQECGWGVLSIPQKKRWKELNVELNKPANAWVLPHSSPQTERDKQQNEAYRLLRAEPLAAWPVQADE